MYQRDGWGGYADLVWLNGKITLVNKNNHQTFFLLTVMTVIMTIKIIIINNSNHHNHNNNNCYDSRKISRGAFLTSSRLARSVD